MRFDCVVFDLDGTLIDSRADLADAVDAALALHDLPRLGPERVAEMVGDGARMLVARALAAAGGGEALVDTLLATFLAEYRTNHRGKTVLYPGARHTVEALVSRGVRCAVVSNKPYEFTASLLDHLGLSAHFCAVLGGDSMPERKPDPAPLLEAIRRCGSSPGRAAIVGDGEPDMRAGASAGITRVGCTFGFRDAERLRDAGAQALIGSMDELLPTLEAM
jgi:phosphoglycolate phosphatase